jgi:putative transcriptional regulator
MESTLDNGHDVKHPFHMENRVRELRERAGLSQNALGAAVGVSRQTINSIERGRYLPSLPLAFALARFFDTLVEEVFDADD